MIPTEQGKCITTSIFVKYNYRTRHGGENRLTGIRLAALPNGMLQERYNPTAREGIWRAGRNAPSLGEQFRVRLRFELLKAKTNWRVQFIPMEPDEFNWED